METANGEWGWTLAAWHRPAGRGAGRGGGGRRPSAGRGGERCRRTARSQVSAGRGSLRRQPRPPRSRARTGPVSIATRVPVVGRACISRGCMNTPGCGCFSRGCTDTAGGGRITRGDRDTTGYSYLEVWVHHPRARSRPRTQGYAGVPRRGTRVSPVGAWHGRDVRAFARGRVIQQGRAPPDRCAVRAVLGAVPCLRRARDVQARGGGSPAADGQAGVLVGCSPPGEVSYPAVASSPPPGTAGQAAGWEPAMRSRSLPSAESTVQSLFALAGAIPLDTKPWQVPVVFLSAASCGSMWFITHLLGDGQPAGSRQTPLRCWEPLPTA